MSVLPSISTISTQANVAYGHTTQKTDGTTQDDPVYENITGPLPSVSTINTQEMLLMATQKHQ